MLQALKKPIHWSDLRHFAWLGSMSKWQNHLKQKLPSWLLEKQQIFHLVIDNEECLLSEYLDGELVGQKSLHLSAKNLTADREIQIQHSAQIIAQLPKRAFITKTIKLPKAARRNLRAVAELQIETETPFLADQVYFSIRPLNAQAAADQIAAELAIVRRDLADTLLAQLSNMGLRPHVLTCSGDSSSEPDHNFLQNNRKTHVNVKLLTIYGLSLFFLAQLGTAIYFPLYMHQQTADSLEKMVQDLTSRAKKLNTTVAVQRNAAQSVRYVIDQRQVHPPLLEIMRSITIATPDSTWLTRLTYQSDRLTLAGFSSSASEFIDTLTEKTILNTPSYISPIVRDSQLGKDRFILSFKVAPVQVTRANP